jgi:tetrahydromethanopterin S-methyltransferase subunit F
MQPLDPHSERLPTPEVSSADLVREAVDEAKQLIRLEVELAKDEVRREVVATKNAGIALGVGAAVLLLGVSLLLVALALAIFPGPIPSLVLGVILVLSALLAGIAGIRLLPKKPLAETRRRLETDIDVVKGRIT